MSEKRVFVGEDCHSQCLKIKIKNGRFETKVGFWGILECKGCTQWDVREWRQKGGKRGEWVSNEREPSVFSCISFLDSCLLDDRIKESFNMTSVLFFDKTHLALPFKLGHTIHNMHLVKRGLASPRSIQIKRGRVHFEFSERSLTLLNLIFLCQAEKNVIILFHTANKTWCCTVVRHNYCVGFCQDTHEVSRDALLQEEQKGEL